MAIEQIELVDENSGAHAAVLVGRGFNCYRFTPVVGGTPVEALWSAPGFAEGEARPSSSGIPLLFPFPGRIGKGTFTFQGKTYSLEAGDGRGNAIHGFVLDRVWQLVEQTPNTATATFHAGQVEPTLLDIWPADFRLTVTYKLAGNRLTSHIVVENPDQRPLPFGFGTHPYFRVPLGTGGDAARCRITVPAGSYWELADMLPTGRKLPVEGGRALARGIDFADTQLDDVLDDLEFAGKSATTTIEDAQSGRTLRQSFDQAFRACVVYNPPHREAFCIEPYTCVPDAFALEARELSPGLRVLAPGERFAARIEIEVD